MVINSTYQKHSKSAKLLTLLRAFKKKPKPKTVQPKQRAIEMEEEVHSEFKLDIECYDNQSDYKPNKIGSQYSKRMSEKTLASSTDRTHLE